jgi:hypothetical protein
MFKHFGLANAAFQPPMTTIAGKRLISARFIFIGYLYVNMTFGIKKTAHCEPYLNVIRLNT